ncbi:unnamed protein product [Rhizoctonia solani]|uniref:Uncharacterized protein n=1 Tax=Rhizoctonia solani TaxID=456999 RepID=A0A8H3D061_9AGAM|nr:unnamed protein product [Rhizoctonia solani]
MQIIQDTESPAAAAIISHIAHSQRVVILTGAGISRAGGIPSFKIGLGPDSTLRPYVASINPLAMVEGATLAMDKQITYVILLFTKASTLTAGFLRQAIQWNLQQSQFPYVFWYLEWDQYKPLDPKMFGGLGTNKAARFYIYLVCSNTPNSAMGEFCEGRWPPTRQFFQTFMTIAMHKLVASSHNSRFCALLHEEAYLPNPQPLWSLYNYATW